MAARTRHVELHASAGLRHLPFAAALRAGACGFDKTVAVTLQAGIPPGNIQAHHAAPDGGPEGYVDLVLKIGAGLGPFLRRTAAPAEDSGENILEAARARTAGFSAPGTFEHVGKVEAAKVEVDTLCPAGPGSWEALAGCATRAASSPGIGLGCGGVDVVGVKTDLIVNLAFLGIAQNVVGFGQDLELFFRGLVAGIDVGVILAGQLAKGFADFVRRGGLVYTQNFVVVLFSSVGH